jgi:hypothetical protein
VPVTSQYLDFKRHTSQLLAHGLLFSPGTPASSTTKTGRHDIAELLLKVALNTIKVIQVPNSLNHQDLLNRFNPATILCLSQASTWISNVIRRGLLILCSMIYSEKWLFVLLKLMKFLVRHRHCKLQKGCTRLASASHKVYQLLAHGLLFSPGTPASSTTKTGRHDIAELLLKVALNTINHHQI